MAMPLHFSLSLSTWLMAHLNHNLRAFAVGFFCPASLCLFSIIKGYYCFIHGALFMNSTKYLNVELVSLFTPFPKSMSAILCKHIINLCKKFYCNNESIRIMSIFCTPALMESWYLFDVWIRNKLMYSNQWSEWTSLSVLPSSDRATFDSK